MYFSNFYLFNLSFPIFHRNENFQRSHSHADEQRMNMGYQFKNIWKILFMLNQHLEVDEALIPSGRSSLAISVTEIPTSPGMKHWYQVADLHSRSPWQRSRRVPVWSVDTEWQTFTRDLRDRDPNESRYEALIPSGRSSHVISVTEIPTSPGMKRWILSCLNTGYWDFYVVIKVSF